MKTIEERAAEIFADRFCTRCPKILYTTCDRKLPGCCRIPEVRCMHEVIKNTIAFEREELTRWHDPKEELPSLLTRVLGRCSDGENISVNIVYRRLTATGKNWFWTDGINAPLDIDGWRKIHA